MTFNKDKNKRTLLKAVDLEVGYRNRSVAKSINFNLSAGELTGIIGINGIGKSTLLRTLGNVQPKLSGSILIGDTPLEDFTALELASQISVVLTEPLASKNMSVLELIALGRQPYTNWIGALSDEDRLRINDAVALLSLEELKHLKCFELSDGQMQRVMIARAIAQDTDIILLDEPTTHLDLYHKVQILNLLKSIAHQTGKAIIFTSHEIEMAIQLCDTIVVLDGEKNHFDTPKILIESKAFDRLFPTDLVTFDAITRSFKIIK